MAVVHGAVLASLIGLDQQLLRLNLAVAEGRLRASIIRTASIRHSSAQPTTPRLNRSIHTARYRQPAVVRMVVMSPAQQRLGAGGWKSCGNRFSATAAAPRLALAQGLNAYGVWP